MSRELSAFELPSNVLEFRVPQTWEVIRLRRDDVQKGMYRFDQFHIFKRSVLLQSLSRHSIWFPQCRSKNVFMEQKIPLTTDIAHIVVRRNSLFERRDREIRHMDLLPSKRIQSVPFLWSCTVSVTWCPVRMGVQV